MNYDLYSQDPGSYFLIFLISLAITLLAYCAFPLIFASARQKTITKKKYRWICYGVNFLVMILFMVVNGGSSGGAYLLWTWVFTKSGIKKLAYRNMLDTKDLPDDEQESASPEQVSNKFIVCTSCGYRDRVLFSTCPKCGSYSTEFIFINQEEQSSPVVKEICFCRKCGRKLIQGSNFCDLCGTAICPNTSN